MKPCPSCGQLACVCGAWAAGGFSVSDGGVNVTRNNATANPDWWENVNLNAGLQAMAEVDPMTRLEGLGQALEFDLRVERPTDANGALDVYRRALAEATRMDVELAIEDAVDGNGNLFTRVRMITRRGDVVAPVEIEQGQSYPEVWHAAFRKLGLLD